MNVVKIATNRYDDANSRLCCASSLLTTLSIVFDAENADRPSDTVVSMALHGIGILIEDAQRSLGH